MPTQRAVLRGAIALGVSFAQKSKQRSRLECWIAFELLDDPLPIILKRVFARLPVMGPLQFGRELSCLLILACCAFTHPRSRSSLALGFPFASFRHIQF